LKKLAPKPLGKLGAQCFEGSAAQQAGDIYSYTKPLNVACHWENSSNRTFRRWSWLTYRYLGRVLRAQMVRCRSSVRGVWAFASRARACVPGGKKTCSAEIAHAIDLASCTGRLATRRLEADLPTIPSGLRGEGALGHPQHPHVSLPLHKMWKAVGKVGECQQKAR
jgi:hypothetical protein